MDCREIFGISIKKYLRNELLASRESINLSQEKMAEKLFIDLRSYADLEKGENKLSLVSFIIYCLRCAPDRSKLFVELEKLLLMAENGIIS